MAVRAGAVLALVAVLAAGCGGGGGAKRCPAPPAGESNAYLPSLSPSSGHAGTNATVTARLPLFDEAGKYVGPGTPRVSAYWNLALEHWTSVLTTPRSPAAAVTGVPVSDAGTHQVTSGCSFRMRVRIPSVPPGRYPIVFVYTYPGGSSDPNGPVSFRVTG
jgi:hypothetical protein